MKLYVNSIVPLQLSLLWLIYIGLAVCMDLHSKESDSEIQKECLQKCFNKCLPNSIFLLLFGPQNRQRMKHFSVYVASPAL